MRSNSLKANRRAGQRLVGAPVALDHDDGRRLLAEDCQALLVDTGPLLVNAARSVLQVPPA